MAVGLLLVVAIASLMLGSMVLWQRSSSSFARRVTFFFTLVFASLWSFFLAMFLSIDNIHALRFVTAIYYIAAAMIFYSFTLFALVYTKTKIRSFYIILATAVIVVIIFVSMFGLLLSNITIGQGGVNNSATINQPFYTVYSVCALALFVAPLIVFVGAWRHVLSPDSRNRIGYMFIAYLLASICGVFFDLILPWVGNYDLIWAGPLGLLVFAGIVYAAMARYRLFDMRTVVVRFLMYVFILTVLSSLYVAILSLIATNEANLSHAGVGFYVANVILVAAIVLLSRPFTKYTNKLVDRWFLRDNYNPNELIAKINHLAVGQHDPYELALQSAREIAKTLRLNYVQIVIEARSDDDRLDAGTVRKIIAQPDESQILALIKTLSQRIVMADDVENYSDVAKLFKKYKIAAFVSIGIESSNASASKGYMLLGAKRRRSIYVQKDHETLAAIANILALAIESARYYQRIRTFNETLKVRVEEATVELRSANRKLKKLDQAKDDFISMAAHQLRTPLTNVRGYISMILDGDLGHITADQRQVLSEANASGQRMALLISDFLDVSRIQTGNFELHSSRISLGEILDAEISQLQSIAAEHNVQLKYHSPDNLPLAMCDRNKLRQVIMNMIDNAIFYSPSGSTVEINLFKDRGAVAFTVRDQGIGVPKDEQAKLFDKFYRGSNAIKVRPDGSGVGLYMARKVIVAHGGTIIFDSEEGKGSTFGFRVPIAK